MPMSPQKDNIGIVNIVTAIDGAPSSWLWLVLPDRRAAWVV
jgi:hypothetical protein